MTVKVDLTTQLPAIVYFGGADGIGVAPDKNRPDVAARTPTGDVAGRAPTPSVAARPPMTSVAARAKTIGEAGGGAAR